MKSHQIVPNGELVPVEHHNMHIYRAGKDSQLKIVIMSGAGNPAPVYDYKVLYEKLLSKYKIIVIEKFGYGYSDLYQCPCDIDSLVSMEREALALLGETGPFVLLPHSMSGLEAIRWKQKYPDEVQAIIGLDMAIPEEYQQWSARSMKMRVNAMKLMSFLKKIGLLAFYPLNKRGLSKEEIKQLKLLVDRNLMGINIMNEASAVLNNAKIVADGGQIECPTLLFVSNGKQVSKNWVKNQQDFAKKMQAKAVYFQCGHCIHYYERQRVAQEIERFIESGFSTK